MYKLTFVRYIKARTEHKTKLLTQQLDIIKVCTFPKFRHSIINTFYNYVHKIDKITVLYFLV